MSNEKLDNERIVIQTLPFANPNENDYAKVFDSGNGIIEVETMKHKPTALEKCKRVSKTQYVDKSTGEIKSYRTTEKRIESKAELRKTFKQLRRIINYNFKSKSNERHITLTYGGQSPMTDEKQVYQDFRRFWGHLKRKFPQLEYVCVLEPQQTGSWHLHVLVKNVASNQLKLYDYWIKSIWDKGFFSISPIRSVDNLGAYFSAYFTDIDLMENQNLEDNPNKRISKGARLKFYKTGTRIYRCSKGIIRPRGKEMTYCQAKEFVKDTPRTFAQTKIITKENSMGKRELNRITYSQYNANRKRK